MLRLSHTRVICDVARARSQILPILPCFGRSAQGLFLGGSSRLVHRSRPFHGIAVSLIGLYLNSTTTLASIEEVSKDVQASTDGILSPPSALSTDLLTSDYDDEPYIANSNSKDTIIPETVWNLHKSTPINLDRIREGIESVVYTGAAVNFNSQGWFIRSEFGLWIGKSVYTFGGFLPVPPLQFQVASCGGIHAEHKNLDYCSLGDDRLRDEFEQKNSSENDDSNPKSKDANNNSVPSPTDVFSSSNADSQSLPALSSSAPVATPPSYSGLIAPDPCDVWGICAIVDVGLPETPVGLPTVDAQPQVTDSLPPIDALAPPFDVPAPPLSQIASVDVPQPELVFSTPQPLKPIPEASTWIMTITGFSFMALAFRKKRRPRINPISFIDIVET